MDWTEKQRRAIDSREGQILVSASAGSGKTAVLVERVIARVSYPDDPRDITRFIIVTLQTPRRECLRIARDKQKARRRPGSPSCAGSLGFIGSARYRIVHAFCCG